jgi:hypothetical protein
MIVSSFYLSDESNIPKALELTGLNLDELSSITGRFARHSHRAGQMRGEVVVKANGQVIIRHHFTKKPLWKGELSVSFEYLDERF